MYWIETIFCVSFLLVFESYGYIFDKTKLTRKQNIVSGSPILMGYMDEVYYFIRPCLDSEITMISVVDGHQWKTEIPFLNKTFPTFAIFVSPPPPNTVQAMHIMHFDNPDSGYMLIAANGKLFQYSTQPNPKFTTFNEYGSSNRLAYEGSNTFYNSKEKRWVSPGKPQKFYRSQGEKSVKFDSSSSNFQQLTENAKDIELFPLMLDDTGVKWILLILKGCGDISYYTGDITESKFSKLSGPTQFSQAENINDFSVSLNKEEKIGYFNTYLRRSNIDCKANNLNWNSVIPLRKELRLIKLRTGSYYLSIEYPVELNVRSELQTGIDISTDNAIIENGLNNFHINVNFKVTPDTTEVGLIARQNRKTKVGVTIGFNLKDKYLYYYKGNDYKNPAEQDYCDCGCPVSKNVSVTSDSFDPPDLDMLADGPVFDAIWSKKFIFTFLVFRDHEDNGFQIFSKGPAKTTFYLYSLD